MLELHRGRPVAEAGRLDKEIRVYDLLDALGIEYYRVDLEIAMTMEACKEIDLALEIGIQGVTDEQTGQAHIPAVRICKNLFLCNRQETDFYLLMMPGDKKFKTKDLSKQLGVARLSFAKESYMEEFLDITPGSVSVLGLMNDNEHRVKLVIDKDVVDSEYFGCHPCINTSSLRIPTRDLLGKILPAVEHEPIFVNLVVEE